MTDASAHRDLTSAVAAVQRIEELDAGIRARAKEDSFDVTVGGKPYDHALTTEERACLRRLCIGNTHARISLLAKQAEVQGVTVQGFEDREGYIDEVVALYRPGSDEEAV